MNPTQVATRLAIVAAYRREICLKCGALVDAETLIPLRHQAEWQLASEGWTLLPLPPRHGDYFQPVMIPAIHTSPGDHIVETRTVNDIPCAVVNRAVVPRVVAGKAGPAHIIGDFAAYKGGKSFWTGAVWTAGYAALPDARVDLIGLEYASCEPEFNYLIDALLSERGMNMPYTQLQNDATHGRMKLRLTSGAEFACRSWERKEVLKGKTRDAYVYCEAYQLPGFECYTKFAQNLRQRKGHALFPTTPDRPWVGYIHDKAHGHNADWHCTCCIDANENPFTYDQEARDRDDPELDGVMTRERFAISWKGQLGTFVGSVYGLARGQQVFTPLSMPQVWRDQVVEDAMTDDALQDLPTSVYDVAKRLIGSPSRADL